MGKVIEFKKFSKRINNDNLDIDEFSSDLTYGTLRDRVRWRKGSGLDHIFWRLDGLACVI